MQVWHSLIDHADHCKSFAREHEGKAAIPVRCLDAVPQAQLAPALCHNYIAARDPLAVLGIGLQRAACLRVQVHQVQPVLFISE
jgi:hypothetical protein